MPTLDEAIAAAFDETTAAPAASAPQETPASSATTAETTAEPAPTAAPSRPEGATAPATPADPTPTSEATPAAPDAPPLSVEDLKAVRERVLADHPELEPVLNATLAEMQRGLNRKFEQVALLRKEAAEQFVKDERLKSVSPDDLNGFLQLTQLATTNPAAAADYLFSVSENLRQQAQNGNVSANPYGQLPPQVQAELQEVRNYMHQQTQSQVIQQIEGEFTKLAPEFGNQAIPETQRLHVLETIQQRGMGVGDIAMVWKSLYGYEHARQQGIKQGQALRQQKAGLSAGATAAAPPPGATNKPKDLWGALDELCSSHGVR